MDPIPSPFSVVAGIALPVIGWLRRQSRSTADRAVPTPGERVEGTAKPAVDLLTTLAGNAAGATSSVAAEGVRIAGVLTAGAAGGVIETGGRAAATLTAGLVRIIADRSVEGVGLTIDGADTLVTGPVRLVAGMVRPRPATPEKRTPAKRPAKRSG